MGGAQAADVLATVKQEVPACVHLEQEFWT